jgi:hypothetical protein
VVIGLSLQVLVKMSLVLRVLLLSMLPHWHYRS